MKTFDHFKPLNEEEYKILDQVVEIINAKTAIACTNCKKCEKVCPQHLPIVELLRDKVDGELWAANPDSKLAQMTSEL